MVGLKERYGREFAEGAAERIREYLDYNGYPVLKQDRYRGDVRTWHVCPCCGSGSGNNGNFTPAFNVYRGKHGDLRWGCFACSDGQKGGDIFDLAEYVEGARTWPEKVEAVARFMGMESDGRAGEWRTVDRSSARSMSTAGVPVKAAVENPAAANAIPAKESDDFRGRWKRNARYVLDCMAHAGETDFFRQRGLNDGTVKRFRLGYDPKEHAAVIPYVDARYRAVETYAKRNVLVGAGEKGRTWKHKNAPGCKKIIFNMEAFLGREKRPVFVVEAPLDAMSIGQAGGAAVALGGTHNANLLEVVDGFTNGMYDLSDIVFVLALDSDAPGDEGAALLAGEFEKRGIAHVKAEHPCFRLYHDPNEALMNDPDLLAEAVCYEVARANAIEEIEREGARPFERGATFGCFNGMDLDGEIAIAQATTGSLRGEGIAESEEHEQCL